MVNILCYVRQLGLFLMFSFFCLDFALFYQVLAKFFNEENFQAISNVQYAYCVCTTTTWLSSAIFNQ